MGAIEPQALYEEFANDPLAFGYKIGNGVSFSDKQSQINEIRNTITVQRKAADQPIGPGEVSESIPVQLIRDAIDAGEYESNCRAASGDDQVVVGQKEYLRDRISTFYAGSDGQSLFAFTEQSKSQILQLFTNPDWSVTRTNLIELQTRDGSRAEELFGSPDAPVTRQDMLDAEAYAVTNSLPSLYT